MKPYDHAVVNECRAKLAEIGCVPFIWSVGDVQTLAKLKGIVLTDDQAMEVLEIARQDHNAELGINWEVLDMHLDFYIEEEMDESVCSDCSPAG